MDEPFQSLNYAIIEQYGVFPEMFSVFIAFLNNTTANQLE